MSNGDNNTYVKCAQSSSYDKGRVGNHITGGWVGVNPKKTATWSLAKRTTDTTSLQATRSLRK